MDVERETGAPAQARGQAIFKKTFFRGDDVGSAGDRQFLKPFGVGARREGYEEGTIEGGTGGRGRVLSLRFANC